jgi:hypothetical protein
MNREAISGERTGWSRQEKQLGKEGPISQKQRVGTSVFIAVRCIDATRAAGTVYESINQSIELSGNHGNTPYSCPE